MLWDSTAHGTPWGKEAMRAGEFWRRIRALLNRQRIIDDLEEEMRLHIELRARRLREEGISAAKADSAARRRFGNGTLLKETSREMWSFLSLETLWRELKLASRTLLHNPGFTVTALLTLGLGIGANTGVFSLVDATLLRSLPYPDPDRLGQVVLDYQGHGEEGFFDDVDGRTWELFRDHAGTLDCAVYSDTTETVNFAADKGVSYVRQQRVSAGYFHVLGVHPLVGRAFTRAEDIDGGPPVVILSYGVWRKVFHEDRTILTQPVRLRGEPYTIVGVMPPELQTSGRADVWTPLRPSTRGEGANNNYTLIGRVKPGANWEQAMTQVEGLGAQRLREEHEIPPGYRVRMILFPLQQRLVSALRTPLLLLWCAVVVVLLIGCINIAGLLIARGAGRRREIGTRMALGGGRAQVLLQLLIESALLAAVAAGLGLLLGWVCISALRAVGRESLGLWQTVELDHRVLVASGVAALFTTLLFGIWPALDASRVDIRTALAEAANRSVAGLRTIWPRRLLIVGEVALGVMLLIAAGLVVRSFLYLYNQPFGFDPHDVVAATLPLQDVRYQTSVKINRLFNDALSRIRELPGVESAAVGMSLPYERGLNTEAQVPGAEAQNTVLTYVTPEYFRVLRIRIARGRAFSYHDNVQAPRVGIVNTFFAKKFFGAADPVGRSLKQGGALVQIVGVVPDVPMKGSMPGYAPVAAIPVIHVPAAQISDDLFQLLNTWFTPSFAVRSSTRPSEVMAGMQRAISSVDPLLPFSGFHAISDIRSEVLAQQRFQALVMSIMAGLALLLAAIGIYGLIAYTVVERTRELGIRMALGASVQQAIESIAMPGLLLALAGTALGTCVSFGAVPLLRHMIWGISTVDPGTYAGTALVVLCIAAAAILIPVLRITQLNPAETLRNE